MNAANTAAIVELRHHLPLVLRRRWLLQPIKSV
jgi:hypothetical protein